MPSTQMPAHQPEPTLTKLFRAAIGPINTDVYLPIFTRFEASGRAGLSWNSAASLYTLNWLVFRGLWGLALGYLAVLVFLPLLTLGLGRLVLDWSQSVELVVGLIGVVLLFVLPGLGGNAIFYQATRKKIEAALAASATFDQACGLLTSQSSSRQRFIRILATNASLLCLLAPLLVLLYARFATESESPLARANDAPVALSSVVSVRPLEAVSAPTPIQVMVASSAPAVSAPAPAVSMSQSAASAPEPAASAAAPVASAPAPVVSSPALAASITALVVSMPTPAISAPAHKESAPQSVAAVADRSVSQPKKPQGSAARAASAGDFFVNVGLFAEAGNAERAHNKISDASLPVASQLVRTPKGEMTRVRVGPFASRSQAADAAKQIKAMKLDAVVVQP